MSAPKKHIFVSDSKPHGHHGDSVNNRTGFGTLEHFVLLEHQHVFCQELGPFLTRDTWHCWFPLTAIRTQLAVCSAFDHFYGRSPGHTDDSDWESNYMIFPAKVLLLLKRWVLSVPTLVKCTLCVHVCTAAAWCYSKIEIVKIHPGWLFESLFPLLRVDPLTRWSAGRFLPR